MLQKYFYFPDLIKIKFEKLRRILLYKNSIRDVSLSRNGPGRDAGHFVSFRDCPGQSGTPGHPNVILTLNKTCKTKLQCCTSHFTTIGLLGLGVTDISVSANSESVSNRKHCNCYRPRSTFASHQKSLTVKRQSMISRL